MPSLSGSIRGNDNMRCITVHHPTLGKTHLYCLPSPPPVGPTNEFEVDPEEEVQPELLFTENNTNFSRLYGGINKTLYVKDTFHDHTIVPSHRPPVSDSQPEAFFSPRIRSRTASLFGAEKPDLPLKKAPARPSLPRLPLSTPAKKVQKLLLITLFTMCLVMVDARLSDSNSHHPGSVKISAWKMK